MQAMIDNLRRDWRSLEALASASNPAIARYKYDGYENILKCSIKDSRPERVDFHNSMMPSQDNRGMKDEDAHHAWM
jgi:hypothetical protein